MAVTERLEPALCISGDSGAEPVQDGGPSKLTVYGRKRLATKIVIVAWEGYDEYVSRRTASVQYTSSPVQVSRIWFWEEDNAGVGNRKTLRCACLIDGERSRRDWKDTVRDGTIRRGRDEEREMKGQVSSSGCR